jgi:uncharacterized protein
MEIRVTDNSDKARYEIHADGELAGYIAYHLSHNDIAFIHTETGERFQGHGVASHLVQASLDSVRERGLEVLPFCPFVRSWIAEHPDYVDLVPAGRRKEFGLD